MNLYIPGMEMPTDSTAITIHKIGGKLYAKRCLADSLHPLIPVPEHGDLVERNALLRVIPGEEMVSRFAVANAPTIIPADPEEEGE